MSPSRQLWTFLGLLTCVRGFQPLLSTSSCHRLNSVSSIKRSFAIVSHSDRPSRVVLCNSNDIESGSSSSNSESDSTMQRKRRVRKTPVGSSNEAEVEVQDLEVNNDDDEEEELEIQVTPLDLKPRDNDPVEMTIQDVRDVVSGTQPAPEVTINDAPEVLSVDTDEVDEEEDDDDEYEYYYDDDEDNAVDSLEQLLVDARQMEQDSLASKAAAGDDGNDDENTGLSIPDSVRNVITTIVTIDFFVVCALLLWFLAGIFGSYVLKDDGIQIAFNGIFQPVVQPALGVLMIGSAAGALFEKEEGDY